MDIIPLKVIEQAKPDYFDWPRTEAESLAYLLLRLGYNSIEEYDAAKKVAPFNKWGDNEFNPDIRLVASHHAYASRICNSEGLRKLRATLEGRYNPNKDVWVDPGIPPDRPVREYLALEKEKCK